MASGLSIGYLSTLYHTSHILRQTGWLESELGVSCSWRLFGTGPEMVRAFETGGLDLGYIGLPPALIGRSRGVPLVCVGGGHVEGTAVVAGPGVRTWDEAGGVRPFLEQFSGRRVGVPAEGSIHDVILRALLDQNPVRGVGVVHHPWADLIPYAMEKGELAAAVGTPALAVLCERECGARVVVRPEQLWPFNPSCGIVAIRDRLEDSGDLITGFLNLHERACNLMRTAPDEAARLAARALPGVDLAFARRVYALSPRYCASLPDAYVESALGFLPVLRWLGLLERDVPAGEVFEREWVRQVHPEPPHY